MAFVKDIAKVIAEQDPADVDALMNCKYVGSDLTVSETMPEKVMSIGENLQIILLLFLAMVTWVDKKGQYLYYKV